MGSARNDRLPENRCQLLWELLKARWLLLFGMSMLLLLFAVPLVLSGFVIHFLKTAELDSLPASGGAEGIDLFLICFRWDFWRFLISLLGGGLLAVGVSGVSRVIQLLAWGEGVVFRQDFAAGIAENCGRFLVGAGCVCLASFSVRLNLDFIRYSRETGVLLTVSSVMTGLAAFVLLMCAVFIAAQALQYRVSLADSVKNALILTVAYFPKNLLLALFLCAPVIAVCAWGIQARLLYLGVMGLFGFSFVILVTVLFCNHILDAAINARIHSENVGRGLRRRPE